MDWAEAAAQGVPGETASARTRLALDLTEIKVSIRRLPLLLGLPVYLVFGRRMSR